MSFNISKGISSLFFGFLLFFVGDFFGLQLNSRVAEVLFKVLGWYYILSSYFGLNKSFRVNPIPSSYISFVRFYIFLTVIMIIRGYIIDYPFIWFSTEGLVNYHFFQIYYILPYLMPLALCIPWKKINFNLFVHVSKYVAIVSIILFVLNFQKMVQQSVLQANIEDFEGSGVTYYTVYSTFSFAVFLFLYISKKNWYFNLLGLVCNTLTLVIAARRGASLIGAIQILFCLYYYRKTLAGGVKTITTIFFIALLVLFALKIMQSDIVMLLFLRGFENNRSGVDNALLDQMNELQMVFGKGLNGRYYYPLFTDTSNDYLNGWRYGSETGFFNLVLKGGYLYAFTYIIMLAIPAIKGLRHSSNMLCKVGGFYILLSLLELYPFGWLAFNIKFLIIWIMISFCMNPIIRNMSDDEIRVNFFNRKS